MSSLDRELQNLQKPIPKGIDLTWLEGGNTFTPSDENNPNAQAVNIMNQLIFNRTIQRVAKKDLMPEERAIAQTVVAHMQAGHEGSGLYSSLVSVFGNEVFQRHSFLIQAVEGAVKTGSVVSSDISPSVGVNVATDSHNISDRTLAKQHEVQRTSGALESYRDNTRMKDGDIALGTSEIDVNIASTGPNADVDLEDPKLDKIKLAAAALMSEIESGENVQDEQISDDMFSENDISKLNYASSEQALLDEVNTATDINFDNDLNDLGNIDMNTENALIGCDEELQGLMAETPARLLLEGDPEATVSEEIEEEEGKNFIQLEDIKQASDIGISLSNELEVEI